ncbi:MAG: hypothetical protein A2521_06835 [Deltaproteobacteria bacterium RIFOXYD12_FULL_57_12]|nr:MAG: hypothetical protein A2521_06835 [Deltaproteobacteria bacterium RIFOXYD12_FULL_57_12]
MNRPNGQVTVRIMLNISSEEFLRYYRGQADSVIATTTDGRRIRFPAVNLRSFISPQGIKGLFELTYTAGNQLVSIRKIR